MEHTVNTMSHAVHMSEQYSGLMDRDLLLTGSFIHDIGKLKEMTGGVSRGYTTEGKLLGHVAMGCLMLEEKLSALREIPADLGLLLKHMVLSHHGSLEFGSPVKPATPEALALHYIDNLDAKMNHLSCFLKDCDQENPWSSFDRHFGVEMYRGRPVKSLMEHLREAAA